MADDAPALAKHIDLQIREAEETPEQEKHREADAETRRNPLRSVKGKADVLKLVRKSKCLP